MGGTPTLFLDGRELQGGASYEQLKSAIDTALARKKATKVLGPGLRPQEMLNPRLPRKLNLQRLDFNPLRRPPAEQPPAQGR